VPARRGTSLWQPALEVQIGAAGVGRESAQRRSLNRTGAKRLRGQQRQRCGASLAPRAVPQLRLWLAWHTT
jgi:hypothetical protein